MRYSPQEATWPEGRMHKVADILNHVHAILVGSNDADQAETFLRNLLDGLDLDTLRRLEAVIYSGRGDGSPVELRPVLAVNHPTKDDVVRTIIEKLPNLYDYLERGLDRANAEGIDLDTF